jgi:hypothetical protein|nr:MAG TPA: hypothetical protein [Caudoviricetes sp.]
MEKVIKKHLTITSVYRDVERLDHEIYSKDKGTAIFKFTTDELTASKVLCLFYFKCTKRYKTVEATIEGNTITVPFDSSLITTDEPVVGYIYFEKVEQSTDVYSFVFNVRVSAIDKAQETPLIERKTGRIVDVAGIVTKHELDELFAKIKEQGGTYDDRNLRTEISHISAEIETLKTKTDKDTVYDDSTLKQRLEALESKPEIDTSSLVTKQELENKGYLTQHQSLTEYAKKTELPQPYNDTELKSRVERLESKPNIDTSSLVTKQELESKHYLTEHQPLTEYAKKSELPQPYNDTELKNRVSRLESKPEIDTSNFATKQELQNIELTPGPKGDKGNDGRDGVGIPQKLSIAGNVVTLSDGGGSITLPTTGGTVAPANEYEIHGTGMPNGKVTAPVGTTYVDTAVTNGALKWIKQKGNDSQGWVVLIGDTGWRNLNIVSKLGSSYLRVRRKNDTITYQFGGLQWGWFGIVRRGGAGYQLQPSDRERNVFILGLQGIPQGFRSEGSLIGGIYNDNGTPYGTWYLGGKGDSNMLRFQFTEPVPTERDIGDIRVSSISYLTDDPWPTTLP